MVPKVGAEKAKGVILSRSVCDAVQFAQKSRSNSCVKVQYIHNVKKTRRKAFVKERYRYLLAIKVNGHVVSSKISVTRS